MSTKPELKNNYQKKTTKQPKPKQINTQKKPPTIDIKADFKTFRSKL